ncbi:MAG: hypothetical protein HOF21_03240 [Nitrospina sp.]|jgi:hypothetical protein|nr:hypothetical protein [Nitrospina sp.]
MAFFARFDSFEKIKKHFLNLSQGMKEARRDTARTLTARAESLARERVKSSSQKPQMGKGSYFRSIKSNFLDGDGSFSGKLESNSPVARILEFGSRPHIIRPKGNKLLFWPGAKHPAKEVRHPGTPAFRVLGDATEEAVADTGKIFESALKQKFN